MSSEAAGGRAAASVRFVAMTAMERRTFLKATLATASGVIWMPGCGSGGDSNSGSPYFPQSVASGDPKPDSVILWTRVEDAARASNDLPLLLEVAKDQAFSQRVTFDGVDHISLTAEARFDHCVKARVTGLESSTVYYYRFHYDHDGARETSRSARTKTAPAPDADVAVSFAVASCQDYAGKYYHAYRYMADMDLDFIVFLGDYIYETVRDPSFQTVDASRSITFDDGKALTIGSGSSSFQAANSLDNYRTLYRTYRADPDLQSAHERFPMVAVWDDHEFSNDCHGAVATYTDGRQDETEVTRRTNADQAWFEYMPVDYASATATSFDAQKPFPADIVIYRDLTFGRHVHLVMTDLRHYRDDHLVDEAAFPGAVALTQADILATVSTLPAFASPYVDIDTFQGGAYRAALQANAAQLGLSADRFTGFIDAHWINQLLASLTPSATLPAPIDETDPTLERGIAFYQFLKTQEFSSVGSRTLLRRPPFDLYALHSYTASNGQSESMLGQTQQDWFLQTLRSSTRTWKVWGNEFTFMRRQIDLRAVTLAPAGYRDQFLLSAEDWDGFPNRRDELLAALAAIGNVVVVSGDLHAFLAGAPYANDDPAQSVVEFVTGSISSLPLMNALERAAAGGAFGNTGVDVLVPQLPSLLMDRKSRANPHLAFLDLADNGFATCKADGSAFETTLYFISADAVALENPGSLDEQFTSQRFRVATGTRDLLRWNAGAWQRWDVATQAWV